MAYPRMIRIGTYNVLGLTGYRPNVSGDAIGEPGSETNSQHFAGVFSHLGCDILALQEGVPPQTIRTIAMKLGMYPATVPSPMLWPGHVLSRFPIRESRTFSHSDPTVKLGPLSRATGATLVELPDGARMWVVNIHLYPGRTPPTVEIRVREAELLVPKLAELESSGDHVVVLGDFNCPVEEAIHQELQSRGYVNAMEQVGGGIAATVEAGGNPLYIDHIYFYPPLAECLVHAQVVRTEGFRQDWPAPAGAWVHSDHLPVYAELDLG